MPSSGKRAAPGTPIDVPLAHKDALYVRSHYDTLTVGFTDSPAPDEVVIIFAFATRGDDAFRLLVDRTLSRIYRNGRIDGILAKTFGDASTDEMLKTMFVINSLPDK